MENPSESESFSDSEGYFYTLDFFFARFSRRCSRVGISSSAVGMSIRQMKAAVRPPLYRQ